MVENEIRTISEFPDDLLLKILSFLPTKHVVATSVLSKRWKSLLNEVKTFRFDGNCAKRSYVKFMLFISGRSIVDRLMLKLSPPYLIKDLKDLVKLAMNRSLRELRIEMLYMSFELPQFLFSINSTHLETLILEKLSLVDVPSNASLIRLKSLHLLSVKFSCDESVRMLLSICPSLEDLVVRRSSYTNVRVFSIDVPTLRSLSIDNSSGKSRPVGVHGFVINAPSLSRFSIRDRFSNHLRFANMPELVNASVNVVCDQPEKLILGSLASTQYLSLCSVTSQTPYLPTGTLFLFLDHLELCSCSADWWNLLTLILKDAPRLRVLKLKLFQKHCVQNNPMVPCNQPSSVPECLSSHLEIFEWRQYNGTEQEREAANYILANASRLKKATFYSFKMGCWS